MNRIIQILSFLALANMSFAQLQVTHLGTHHEYVYDEGAAEITAYHPATNQMFVVNANDTSVDIIDISDPQNPIKTGAIDIEPYGAGANSVDITGPVLVIAVEGEEVDSPGKILFYNIPSSTVVYEAETGPLPDMVEVSHGGNIIMSANEGEPNDNYDNDPEGSVTMIEYNGPMNIIETQISFAKFNGMKESLINRGVKLFGPNATVAQDLEPEYIAFTEDDKYAYVSCQENNCFVVIDVEAKEAIDILPNGFKAHEIGTPTLTNYILNDAVDDWPILGTPVYNGGQEPVSLGGFSGLWADPVESTENEIVFYTIPDRGPNDSPVSNPNGGLNLRPFKLPKYQARIVKFTMNPNTGEINFDENDQIFLTGKDGTTTISGRGNIPGVDEVPVTYSDPNTEYANVDYTVEGIDYHALPYDPYGGDFEGIVRNPEDGSFWMCDEYRPAIYHFDANGQLIERYVTEGISQSGDTPQPEGTYGAETIPEVYSKRRPNRGFEALALDWDNGILYAFIQTPLYNPDNSTRNNSDVIRILGIDPATGEPVSEYIYLLEDNKFNGHKASRVDKIGDAVYLGDGLFAIIERDSSMPEEERGKKYLFVIDINNATNILGTELSNKMTSTGEEDKTLEMMTADDLKAADINPVFKIKMVNLPSLGYLVSDKAEGLAVFPFGDDDEDIAFAVLNDNDFGLAGAGVTDNSQLGIITFDEMAYAFDASNRDDAIKLNNWPVWGTYQPDGIHSYVSNGRNYIVTANEGDARDYDGYSEEERVKDLTLDPDYFEEIDELQMDGNLGRLNTTTALGDIDGDGEHEYIFSYGARSMSIFDEYGNLVFDTGNEISLVTAELYPDHFNSNDDYDSFDSRSDDKGAEPENLDIGIINDRTYAFLCLERIGGFMIYDITDVKDVQFIDYINRRDFEVAFNADDGITEDQFDAIGDIGPEGMLFIPADDSPNGQNLLITSNEITGSTSIFQIDIVNSVENGFFANDENVINYVGPNPFSERTTVNFELKKASEVEIILTDMNGNQVLTHNKFYNQGIAEFNLNTKGLPSGAYIISLRAGEQTGSYKLIKK